MQTVRVPELLGSAKILLKSFKSLLTVQQRNRQMTDGQLMP